MKTKITDSHRLLMLSSMIDDLDIPDVIKNSKCLPGFAANTHQKALIEGFATNGYMVDCINASSVQLFPSRYKKIFFSTKNKKGYSKNLKFINIIGLRQFVQTLKITRAMARYYRTYQNVPLFVYGASGVFCWAMKLFNFLHPKQKCRSFVIIVDLPGFVGRDSGRSKVYRRLKNCEESIFEKNIHLFDGFILLAEAMIEKLHLEKAKCAVIEGIVDQATLNFDLDAEITRRKTIVYTGKLDWEFGIIGLLNALTEIQDSEVRLQLYGYGNGIEEIKRRQIKDPRIELYPPRSHQSIIQIQRTSHILVNPRSSKEEFTKYSFPSKTMEYLASGRPVVMGLLQALPSEYHPYLYLCDTDNPIAFAQKMVEALNEDDSTIKKRGRDAIEFLIREKTSSVQAKKIIDLIYRDE